MDYELKTKPGFKLIGYELRTSCKDGQNHRDIPAFWSTYLKEGKGCRIPNRIHEDSWVELGICTDFDMESGDLTYIIGMEARSFDDVPVDMVCREFPEARYAVFTTPKVPQVQFSASIQSTWGTIFSEWFPHSGFEHAGSAEFEYYDERCHQKLHDLLQMDIYIPIKEK